MDRGYVKFPRYIFASEEWKAKRTFTSFEAQAYLLQAAVYVPTEVEVSRGVFITLQRGQLVTSVRKLAKCWGWEKTKVHRFLHTLIEGKFGRLRITMQSTGKGLYALITIPDYDVLVESATLCATLCATPNATPNALTDRNMCNEGATPNVTLCATPNATHIEEYIINTHTGKYNKEGVVGGEKANACKLLAYVCEHHPELQRMRIPLTEIQAGWILRRCSMESAKRIFSEMANKRVSERNTSVYSTFTTFMKYDRSLREELKSQKIYTYREMCDYVSNMGGTTHDFVRIGQDRWVLKSGNYAGGTNS